MGYLRVGLLKGQVWAQRSYEPRRRLINPAYTGTAQRPRQGACGNVAASEQELKFTPRAGDTL